MNRKRMFFICTLPLAFALAALLGWSSGRPAEIANTPATSEAPVRRSTAAAADKSLGGVSGSAIVAQFEREYLQSPVPPEEIFDAEGMEAAIDSDYGASFPGGGMSAGHYSRDWANSAPEEMLSWLSKQSGSSIERGRFPAYVLFATWAEQSLGAALAAVPRISDLRIRRQALISSLEVLCESDPDRARELLAQNLELFRYSEHDPIFNAEKGGRVMCDLLLSLPSSKERSYLLATLLRSMAGWNEELASQAESVWLAAPGDLQTGLVAAGFTIKGDSNHSFAGLEELMQTRAEKNRHSGAPEAFLNAHGPAWAKRDLAGALEWAGNYFKGRSRVERRAELFRHAAGAVFDETVNIWKALPDGYLKVRAAGAISKGAPAERKSDAQALLDSLSEYDQLRAIR